MNCAIYTLTPWKMINTRVSEFYNAKSTVNEKRTNETNLEFREGGRVQKTFLGKRGDGYFLRKTQSKKLP